MANCAKREMSLNKGSVLFMTFPRWIELFTNTLTRWHCQCVKIKMNVIKKRTDGKKSEGQTSHALVSSPAWSEKVLPPIRFNMPRLLATSSLAWPLRSLRKLASLATKLVRSTWYKSKVNSEGQNARWPPHSSGMGLDRVFPKPEIWPKYSAGFEKH